MPSPIYLSMIPSMLAHRDRHRGEVAVDDRHQARGRGEIAQRGRALHVAEQDGHDAPLAAGGDQLGRSTRPSTMRGSTYLPKVSLICDLSLQIGHHGIEGAGKQADLVARGHRHHRVELAVLHGGGAGEQPPHRARQAAREAARDQEPQQAGEAGDHHHGAHDVGLARLRRVGGGGYDAVELAACLLDLAIIILALGVERGQQGAQARRVGRGRQRLYQRRLPLRHIGTPLLDHLEQRVEARQGHGIPRLEPPSARRGSRARAAAISRAPAAAASSTSRRSSSLLAAALAVADVDVEAADVERALQRADVGAGQRGVAFDVGCAPGPAARG